MQIRLARPLQSDSIVDGVGLRTVLWTQGCTHNCLGCHNPSTHDLKSGYLVDVEEIKKEISNLKYQDGITLSGGDPFLQAKAVLEIAKYIKSSGLNIWAYTGFTFEQLLLISKKKPEVLELLNYVDILVDGKFKLEERSLDWQFRGSKNQRIIDVKKSLKYNETVIIKKYNKSNINIPIYKREEHIYV